MENLSIQKGQEFVSSLNSLAKLQELVSSTKASIFGLKGELENADNKINEKIQTLESLDTQRKASGVE